MKPEKNEQQQQGHGQQQGQQPEKPKTVKVTIVVDSHEHAGRPVAQGATLEVSEPVAAWLVENKIGERA